MTTNFRMSPVIGVIIMVGITVILAAGVAWLVFGMGSSMQKEIPVTITGLVLQKDSTTQEIRFVDEGARDTVALHVKENAAFNSIQQFKRYELSVRGKEVLSVKGPL